MSDLQIADLDPFDDAEFDEFHAVFEAAQVFGREATATPWERDELRAAMQEDARDGSATASVGASTAAWWPSARSRGRCATTSTVRAAGQRAARGAAQGLRVGAARPLRGGRARARPVDRRWPCVDWPFDAHPDGDGDAGVEFARAHGYSMALVEIQRRLDLPVEEETLDRLAAAAAEHHRATRSARGPDRSPTSCSRAGPR